MTEEQGIISSGSPHEVHLAEGSHTAVHKSATAMEPQVHNTTANPDESVELISMADVISHRQVDEVKAARTSAIALGTRMARDGAVAVDTGGEETQVRHMEDGIEPPDRMVSEAATVQAPMAHSGVLPLEQVMGDLPSLELHAPDAASGAHSETPPTAPPAIDKATAGTQETTAQTDTSESKQDVAATAQFMAEMNFPALVVKLKLANDQIRKQIEKLEKPLFVPIAVAAPVAAKGKEKEAAKKPAKGH